MGKSPATSLNFLVLTLTLMGLIPGDGQAADVLWPDAIALLGTGPYCAFCLDLGGMSGWVAPFEAAEEDRAFVGVNARYAPAEAVELRIRLEGLAASWPDGARTIGPGDLRLGTSARILPGSGPRPALWLDWEVKLPNAATELGLGTDETDVAAMALARWAGPEGTITAGAGLVILGDPLRYSAQDDAALALLTASRPLGPTRVLARAGGRLPSPRNPADLSVGLGVEAARASMRAGVELSAGLTPAAADVGARLWIGARSPCGAQVP